MIDVPEIGVFGEADGKKVVLGRHDAMQPELQLTEHVDQMLLVRVARQILLFEIADESVEGFISSGVSVSTCAGEPMAGCVERRALFPFLGARPSRFLGVQAIGAKLGFGRRATDGGWDDGWFEFFL